MIFSELFSEHIKHVLRQVQILSFFNHLSRPSSSLYCTNVSSSFTLLKIILSVYLHDNHATSFNLLNFEFPIQLHFLIAYNPAHYYLKLFILSSFKLLHLPLPLV